jgi:hypothetical protein
VHNLVLPNCSNSYDRFGRLTLDVSDQPKLSFARLKTIRMKIQAEEVSASTDFGSKLQG